MYVVSGVTGQVGSVVARSLLAAGRNVRAIVRRPEKIAEWRGQGCEVAQVDLDDSDGLAAACTHADGVFVLLPPNFDPAPDFRESRALIASLRNAFERARPRKIVCLSSIGAQATETNLLSQLGMLEQAMRDLPVPVAFLRAAWFMENAAWDVEPARDEGVLFSFLQPLDQAQPMISVIDVGRVAAQLLQEQWSGVRVVELAHAHAVSPNTLAASFARALGRDVRVETVARETWETRFRAQGMRNPVPRMRMLDGFNEGWIRFEGAACESHAGSASIDEVLRDLVAR
jgi:uncharacterized protein YbjT (DUF2867 family)